MKKEATLVLSLYFIIMRDRHTIIGMNLIIAITTIVINLKTKMVFMVICLQWHTIFLPKRAADIICRFSRRTARSEFLRKIIVFDVILTAE